LLWLWLVRAAIVASLGLHRRWWWRSKLGDCRDVLRHGVV
jgi:hypothetical protein